MVKKLFFDACQPCEGIFELHSCCGLIFMTVFGNFDRLVLTHQTFFQKNFWLKSLLLVSTISGQMWKEIRQPQSNSNIYDIVLQISFLDINSQNWNTGSHLKLLQKSLKIQYIFQKFLCTTDGPDKTEYWIQKFFCSGPFLISLQI